MTHIPLKAGDVRQIGDEYRIPQMQSAYPCKGSLPVPQDQFAQFTQMIHYFRAGPWHPVRLIGELILPADLISANFRRPIQ